MGKGEEMKYIIAEHYEGTSFKNDRIITNDDGEVLTFDRLKDVSEAIKQHQKEMPVACSVYKLTCINCK